MAKLLFAGGGERNVKAEVGLSIWRILSGQEEPTSDQEAYIAKVSKIYLNWRAAPDDYIEEKFDIIVQLHFGDWMVHHCENAGCPQTFMLTCPDPAREDAVAFADKWGLIQHGVITRKGQQYIAKYQVRR